MPQFPFCQIRVPSGAPDSQAMLGNPSVQALHEPVYSYGDEYHHCYYDRRAQEADDLGIYVELVYKQTVQPFFYAAHFVRFAELFQYPCNG